MLPHDKKNTQRDSDYLESLIKENEAAGFLGYTARALQNWRVRGGGPSFVKVSKRSIRYRRRDLLGAVSEFEKASLVEKLRKARERKRSETGRCEGRKPVPEVVVKEAKRLYRKSPRTGKRRSLRAIAKELVELGHVTVRGKPYGAESIKRMVLT